MTFKELKLFCDDKMVKFPQYMNKYKKELIYVKRFYKNNVNLFELISENKDKLKTCYIIPFLLGLTNKVTNEEWEYEMIKAGGSGGIDVDMDWDPIGKEKIYKYLVEKFGKDRVFHVGTFSRLGPASAAKDLLRIYKIDFFKSNNFTRVLDTDKTWEENVEYIKENHHEQYDFYLKNKEVLDLTKYFIGKIRNSGKHAGGVTVLNKSAYEIMPVDRIQGEVVSAFPESSQEQSLDEIGCVKLDVLAISILDAIKGAINAVDDNKKLFLIEEDGVRKIVDEEYLDNN